MGTVDKEFLIRVKADIEKAVADMRRMTSELDKQGKGAKTAATNTRAYGGAMRSITAAIGAYITVASLVKGLKLADEFNVLQVRIKTATKATGDYNKVSKEIFDIAQRNGVALKVTVDTFQRMSIVRAEIGATNSELLKVTEAVQQLGIQSGASTTAMQAGMLQFSQGLATGTFKAEEMNSVIENMPAVAERIARGMGMTVGQMRQAVLEGKLLSKDVFDSLLKQAPEIATEMGEIPLSLARSTTMLVTSIGKFFSQLDQATSITAFIAKQFKDISKGLDVAGQYLNPTGENKLNLLVEERNKLLEEQARIEKDIWEGRINLESASGRANLAYAQQLKDRISLVTEEIKKMQDLKAEQDKVGSAGVKSATATEKAQKKLSERLTIVTDELKKQLSLFDKQKQAVEEAKKNAKDFATTATEAQESLNQVGETEPKAPGVLDIANQISKANALLKNNDFKGAQAAAEETFLIIQAAAEAGTAADLTLKDYFNSAKNIGNEAAQALVDSEQAAFEEVKNSITELLVEAKQLKSLQVGFDQDKALEQAEILRTNLQEEFEKNPLVLPVILQKPDTQLKALDKIINSLTPDALPAKAAGGPITGPGTGTSDSVLMWGSAGEYMVRTAAVKHYGLDAMQRINSMQAPRYADGGMIGAARPQISLNDSPATTPGGRPITLVLDGKDYAMQAHENTAQMLEREFLKASMKMGYRVR